MSTRWKRVPNAVSLELYQIWYLPLVRKCLFVSALCIMKLSLLFKSELRTRPVLQTAITSIILMHTV